MAEVPAESSLLAMATGDPNDSGTSYGTARVIEDDAYTRTAREHEREHPDVPNQGRYDEEGEEVVVAASGAHTQQTADESIERIGRSDADGAAAASTSASASGSASPCASGLPPQATHAGASPDEARNAAPIFDGVNGHKNHAAGGWHGGTHDTHPSQLSPSSQAIMPKRLEMVLGEASVEEPAWLSAHNGSSSRGSRGSNNGSAAGSLMASGSVNTNPSIPDAIIHPMDAGRSAGRNPSMTAAATSTSDSISTRGSLTQLQHQHQQLHHEHPPHQPHQQRPQAQGPAESQVLSHVLSQASSWASSVAASGAEQRQKEGGHAEQHLSSTAPLCHARPDPSATLPAAMLTPDRIRRGASTGVATGADSDAPAPASSSRAAAGTTTTKTPSSNPGLVPPTATKEAEVPRAASSRPPVAADLGDEWKSAVDDKDRRYFYNRRTRESRWHIPENCIKIVTNKATGEFRLFSPAPAAPNGSNVGDSTTPATKPLVRLHSQVGQLGWVN